jgi:DNA-directed RNA polymerase subunit RPC12/RpoP
MNDKAVFEAMEKGIRCPACGCRDLHVVNTIVQLGRIIRYRQCRHCGKRIRTKERIDYAQNYVEKGISAFDQGSGTAGPQSRPAGDGGDAQGGDPPKRRTHTKTPTRGKNAGNKKKV